MSTILCSGKCFLRLFLSFHQSAIRGAHTRRSNRHDAKLDFDEINSLESFFSSLCCFFSFVHFLRPSTIENHRNGTSRAGIFLCNSSIPPAPPPPSAPDRKEEKGWKFNLDLVYGFEFIILFRFTDRATVGTYCPGSVSILALCGVPLEIEGKEVGG